METGSPSSPISPKSISSFDSDYDLPLNKYITPVIDNILLITMFTQIDFNITTKDKSGFITLPKSHQSLILTALNSFSEEHFQLPDDIKKIIFHKFLDTVINSEPTGINHGPLYNTLVFRNIRVQDLDLPYLPSDSNSDSDDSDDDAPQWYAFDDDDWFRGDE